MNIGLFLKVTSIWFLISILAIVNGIFRESILVPAIGGSIALPVSGLILSIFIFMVTYLFFSLFGKNNFTTYLLIGIQWVVMTLIFEVLFGHYMFGKSWIDILEVFNVMKGNLFVIVLLVSLTSPLLVSKIKK